MPVVRELINRISFKVNPADKKNAKDTISNLEKGSKRAIINIKGIGKALTASLLAASAASTKMFVDFEKDTGASAFFARNRQEAKELNTLLDEVARRSETTSKREARRASKTLSQTTLTQKQLKDFIPFLEKISIARPDLDFTGVAENFRDIISGGNLSGITEIVTGFKDTAELLSKTTFQSPFGDITEQQRGQILLEALIKSQPKLDELVKEQRETLNFQFSALAKESSDFALKFGEEIAPAVKESLIILKDLIKELNESESFWTTVGNTVESIKSGLLFIKDIFSDSEETNGKPKAIKGFRDEELELGKNISKDIFNIPKSIFEGFQKSIQDIFGQKQPEIAKEGIKNIPISLPGIQQKEDILLNKRQEEAPGEGSESFLRMLKRESSVRGKVDNNQGVSNEQSLNINLNGSIKVENESGVEISQMSSDLTTRVFDELRTAFNNINAQNGGFVGV